MTDFGDGISLTEDLLVLVDSLFDGWVGRQKRFLIDEGVARNALVELVGLIPELEFYNDEPRLELVNRKVIWLLDMFPGLEGEFGEGVVPVVDDEGVDDPPVVDDPVDGQANEGTDEPIDEPIDAPPAD